MIIRKVKTTNDVKQLFLESNGEISFGVTKSKKLYIVQADEIVEISPYQAAREFQLDVNEIYEKIELALNEDLEPIEEQDIKAFSESKDESKDESETTQNVRDTEDSAESSVQMVEPNKVEKIEITENSEIDNSTFSVEKLDSEKLVEKVDKIIRDLKLVIDELEKLK